MPEVLPVKNLLLQVPTATFTTSHPVYQQEEYELEAWLSLNSNRKMIEVGSLRGMSSAQHTQPPSTL